MIRVTPERASIAADEARSSNIVIDQARLEAALDALIDAEGFPNTVERVQRLLRSQAARRQIPGWIS